MRKRTGALTARQSNGGTLTRTPPSTLFLRASQLMWGIVQKVCVQKCVSAFCDVQPLERFIAVINYLYHKSSVYKLNMKSI